VASGIPLTLLLLRGLPQADGAAGAVDRFAAPYAALLFIMGMLVSWPQARAALPCAPRLKAPRAPMPRSWCSHDVVRSYGARPSVPYTMKRRRGARTCTL